MVPFLGMVTARWKPGAPHSLPRSVPCSTAFTPADDRDPRNHPTGPFGPVRARMVGPVLSTRRQGLGLRAGFGDSPVGECGTVDVGPLDGFGARPGLPVFG